MRHIVGVGTVGGIGFTVSLFITELAFDDPVSIADTKHAVLVGSVAAAAFGAALLWLAGRPQALPTHETTSQRSPCAAVWVPDIESWLVRRHVGTR